MTNCLIRRDDIAGNPRNKSVCRSTTTCSRRESRQPTTTGACPHESFFFSLSTFLWILINGVGHLCVHSIKQSGQSVRPVIAFCFTHHGHQLRVRLRRQSLCAFCDIVCATSFQTAFVLPSYYVMLVSRDGWTFTPNTTRTMFHAT